MNFIKYGDSTWDGAHYSEEEKYKDGFSYTRWNNKKRGIEMAITINKLISGAFNIITNGGVLNQQDMKRLWSGLKDKMTMKNLTGLGK